MNCQWPGCTRKATKITKTIDRETGRVQLYRECYFHYAPADVHYIEEDITEEEYLTLKLEATL